MNTQSNKRKKPNQKQRIIFTVLVLVIPLINFAVFTIGMNSTMFINSFKKTVNGESVFAGFHQYKVLFRNLTDMTGKQDIPFVTLKNTLLIIPVSVLTTCISLFMSYAVARRFLGYRFFRIILYAPCILSTVVMASIFKIICTEGVINTWFGEKFMGSVLDPSNIWNIIIIFSIWSGCVINLYFMSAFARLPDSVFESAELDGASETVLFFRITFPLVSSLFVTMLLSSVCGAFTFFAPIFFFTPANDTSYKHAYTLGYKLVIFANDHAGDLDADAGLYSALGVILTIVASLVAVLTRWVGSKLAVEDLEY